MPIQSRCNQAAQNAEEQAKKNILRVLKKRIAELAASGERIMREGGFKVETAPQ